MKSKCELQNLYSRYAHVLSPLGYPCLLDIAHDLFATFRQTINGHVHLSEALTIYLAAQRYAHLCHTAKSQQDVPNRPIQAIHLLSHQASSFEPRYHGPYGKIETSLNMPINLFKNLEFQLVPTASGDNMTINNQALSSILTISLIDTLLAPIPCDPAALIGLFKQYFGTDATPESVSRVDTFCQMAAINRDELNQYLASSPLRRSLNSLPKDLTTRDITINPAEFGAQYLNAGNVTAENFITLIDESSHGECLSIDMSTLSQINGAASSCYLLPPSAPDTLRFRYKHTRRTYATGADTLEVKLNSTLIEKREVNNPYSHWLEFSLKLNTTREGEIRIDHNPEWSILRYHKASCLVRSDQLIRLRNIIIYCQHVGLSPITLDRLIMLSQKDATPAAINLQTLQLTARVLEYISHFGVNEDDALVMVGGNINVYAKTGSLNQFDQLFNNPPLNGINFTTDQAIDNLDMHPNSACCLQERQVLKRAFSINDDELQTLTIMSKPEVTQKVTNLQRISMLYRLCLWEKHHKLTPKSLQPC